MFSLEQIIKMNGQFKCFRCGEVFENKYASKVDKGLCKYCEEFDDENGELKEV